MTWFKWTLTNFGPKGFVIRRYRKLNGKTVWQSYPKKKCKAFDHEQLTALVAKLNATRKQPLELCSPYVNHSILSKFEAMLKTRSNRNAHVVALMGCLHNHVLKFFVHSKRLPNPNSWKACEYEFGDYLLKQKISAAHIVRITQTTNRLIKFLHENFPEIRNRRLDPVSLHVMKDIVTTNTHRVKYIPEDVFQQICQSMSPFILPNVKLAYCYGLRRAETFGLTAAHIYEDSISVERQLTKVNPVCFSSLKSKEFRQVPHWFTSPEETYKLIADVKVMHPDTLGEAFRQQMKSIGLSFTFHDLRRTFITNALRTQHYRDVQLAAGHSDLKTTQRYAQDDRRMQRKQFVPLCPV